MKSIDAAAFTALNETRLSVERRIVRTVLGIAAMLLVARTKVDPDLWGHLRFGAELLSSGFPSRDPYSFTSDIPWVNHEWLAEILMWSAWAAAGSVGLIVLKMGVLAGVLISVTYVLWGTGTRRLAMELLLLMVLFTTWPRTSLVRPQLFSLLLFALLLLVLQCIRRHPRWVGWVPAILCVWVNLHGGWVVGAGAIGVWTLAALVSREPPLRPPRILLTALASGTALLINPYGWRMLAFIGTTVRFERADIVEWQPIWHSSLFFSLWLVTASSAGWIVWSRWRQVEHWQLLIILGLGVSAFRVSRLDAFFALAVVMLLGPHLGDRKRIRGRSLGVSLATLLTTVLAGAGLVVSTASPSYACIGLDVPWLPEREAGAAIKAAGLSGRLLSWFGWGQYVIWHFGPDMSVSLDGRRETVYSAELLKQMDLLYANPRENLEMLERLDADLAWLPRGVPIVDELRAQGWTELFSGPRSVVLSRRALSPLIVPVVTTPACFPGP